MKYLTKLIPFLFLLISCSEKVGEGTETWNVIQEEILTPQCVNCHMQGTTIAKQSGLILSEGASYSALVGALPKNLAAKNDNLVIVSNEGGLKGLGKSFLWEKINAHDREHYLGDHPDYGQMMPPGENFLTDGQLQFIRSWIEAGAPELGIVSDEKLLLDSNRYEPPSFQPLAPPETGFQLHLGPFEVPPNYEREFFHYTDTKLSEDVFVNRIQIEMRPGSHHFILYSFEPDTKSGRLPAFGVDRELRDPDGAIHTPTLMTMLNHQFFGGTQWPRMDYKLPPGVAMRLPSQFGLDQNVHYVNRSDSIIVGEVYSNIYTVERTKVNHVAELFAMSSVDFSLPPKKVTTITRTFYMNKNVKIGQIFSHAHELMTEFVVKISGGSRDGEVVYWTDDWQHPPILEYDPLIELNSGEGLMLTATYDNSTDQTVKFGFLSTDEMMILFGWFFE
ncbi:MAG: hypothetical protein ISR82_04980 [Candidatus Marinimicrobia bacterium]|nr:hypothetical protein [Candidatus Neomarinimicrobiota bacterium]MBL7010553.1 hypothetical protein [Candidatus Neomarinimicrobiota bacterium]MBL7030508.1 hypothetical protein [Candidatus Neomarinimicrobiota bacterium]